MSAVVSNCPEWQNVARKVCSSCKKGKFPYRSQAIYAREFTNKQTMMLRVATMDASQTLASGVVDIQSGVIDGQHLEFNQRVRRAPQSKSTGGLGKSCGFDATPRPAERILNVYVSLTKLYYHDEDCLSDYIGSEHQDGQNSANRYIGNNTSLHAINEDYQARFDENIISELEDMAYFIDGNNVLGNWKGDDNGAITPNSGNSEFHQYTGWIPRILLASKNVEYNTVDWELPTYTTGSYYFRYRNQYRNVIEDATEITTPVLMAQALNEARDSVTEARLFTAGIVDGKVRVTAQDPAENLLGPDGLQLYYFEDGLFDDCADALPCEVIQNYTPIVQSPYIKEFTRFNKENILDYWIQTMCDINLHVSRCAAKGYVIPNGHFAFIDPEMMPLLEFAKLIDAKGNCCAGEWEDRFTSSMPRFIPLEVLRGTSFWLWSVPLNLMFTTNLAAVTSGNPELSDIIHGVDRKCGTVWIKNEMLAGCQVKNLCLVATNACNSPLDKNLSLKVYKHPKSPHQFKQMVRPDVCVVEENRGILAVANICKTPVDVADPASGYVVSIDGTDSVGANEYSWVIATQDGSVIPPITDASGEFTVLPAALMNMSSITLTVTDASGTKSDPTTISMVDIPSCEDC